MSSGARAPDAAAKRCFVCGPDNPIGLRIAFRIEAGRCLGAFCPAPEHAGFDGVTHGGIVFSVLDDAMANWFYLQGARGFTARADIRYRAPLPIGTPIDIECTLVRRKGRLVQLSSRAVAREGDTLYAESAASFMLDPGAQLAPE